MAWTTPRTWSPGETVTATLMNAHVRDNLNAVSSRMIAIGIGGPTSGVLPTGVAAYVYIPASLKIVAWTLVAHESGSLVLDLWKDTYANFPPLVGDSIAGTEKPTLVTAQKNQDLSLTTWDVDIDAGDVLAINVDSVTTIQQATLTLHCEPR